MDLGGSGTARGAEALGPAASERDGRGVGERGVAQRMLAGEAGE